MNRAARATQPASRRAAEAADRERIAKLCDWFSSSARDLPWRKHRKRWGAWGALVAETMLQQTQVARVAERIGAFMRRFSTPAAMAAADEAEVLALWQGMGYYRRARNLHAAARMICERFRGRVPRSLDDLRSLPGVGRYTAGAIASIIFNDAQPIVDGNVRRVLARWDARSPRATDAPSDGWAWTRAEALVSLTAIDSPSLPGRGPGGGSSAQPSGSLSPSPAVFNEALMELGATVCTPRNPRCDQCPVSALCLARARNLQDRIPAPKAAPRRRTIHHHAVIITHRGRTLLEQRPSRGLWGGLWQLPTVEADRRLPLPHLGRQLASKLAAPGAVYAALGTLTPRARFTFNTTHREVLFHIFALAPAPTRATRDGASNGPTNGPASGLSWHSPRQLEALPLSSAHRRVLALAMQVK